LRSLAVRAALASSPWGCLSYGASMSA